MISMTAVRVLGAALMFGSAVQLAAQAPPAPDLTGLWTFEIAVDASVTRGAMTLAPAAAESPGYRGMLITSRGPHALEIRSLTLQGPDMAMLVQAERGNVTFAGRLGADGQSFTGTITYFNGQRFPMSGRKQ